MTDKGHKKGENIKSLRAQAEKIAQETQEIQSNLSETSLKELVHELKVHQIELEMQNHSLQESQKQLQDSRKTFMDLYHNAPAGYLSADEFGLVTQANTTLAGMLNADIQDLVGTNLSAWCVEQDAFYLHCRALVKNGTGIEGELQFKNKADKIIHVSIESRLIKERPEKEYEIRSVLLDISEKKRLEEQFHHAQKMESVGRLAGGVAHDFNNMLNVILGYAQMALEQTDVAHPCHDMLTEIQNAANRSADIVQKLLAFASKQTILPKTTDLDEVIGNMTTLLCRLIGENIALAWHPGKNLWPVRIDHSQLDQIMTNLVVNAKDAVNGVGKITVSTGNITVEEEYSALNPCFLSGDFVYIEIRDNGCGMDTKTLKKIFDPFYTTKPMGEGTGLGLSTIQGIVQQNNGFINVDSRINQGTVFKIYLPRYVGPVEVKTPKKQTTPSANGSQTILVVEDEPQILRMITRMLNTFGYTILGAATPGEAIRMAGEYEGTIHMLITDVIMPEMNGNDLSQTIRSCCPDIKLLFMSGYTKDVMAKNGLMDNGLNFIQKPFFQDELAAKLKEILDH